MLIPRQHQSGHLLAKVFSSASVLLEIHFFVIARGSNGSFVSGFIVRLDRLEISQIASTSFCRKPSRKARAFAVVSIPSRAMFWILVSIMS